MSAIDWLSDTVVPPVIKKIEPPVADNAAPPAITVTPLDQPSKDPYGLLPSTVTGLPRSIWAQSNEATLVALVGAERAGSIPAMQELLRVLLLAEADPPAGAGADGALFVARVDKLLELGSIEAAKALIEEAKPDNAALFRRWFDVALLTGTEDTACDVMGQTPAVAPSFSARIFCLARSGDWNAAALTLNTHRVLGDISPQDEALISRFLDPELYEGEPDLAAPAQISPLKFRMHEAIGEPLITDNLPLAFAHADLRTTTAWKTQISAAERLIRYGALSENVLLQVYTAQTPAASGGIWDRADAIQQFDAALRANDAEAVATALPAAWTAMKQARAEVAFAKLYGVQLQDLQLPPAAQKTAATVGLLSPVYEAVALSVSDDVAHPFLKALARGVPQEVRVTTPKELAIQSAFNGTQPPEVLQDLLDEGKLGEALLRAISIFNQGYAGDPQALTEALSVMRAVGLEDVARRSALQVLMLDRPL